MPKTPYMAISIVRLDHSTFPALHHVQDIRICSWLEKLNMVGFTWLTQWMTATQLWFLFILA